MFRAPGCRADSCAPQSSPNAPDLSWAAVLRITGCILGHFVLEPQRDHSLQPLTERRQHTFVQFSDVHVALWNMRSDIEVNPVIVVDCAQSRSERSKIRSGLRRKRIRRAGTCCPRSAAAGSPQPETSRNRVELQCRLVGRARRSSRHRRRYWYVRRRLRAPHGMSQHLLAQRH